MSKQRFVLHKKQIIKLQEHRIPPAKQKKNCNFTIGCPPMERGYCNVHNDWRERCEKRFGEHKGKPGTHSNWRGPMQPLSLKQPLSVKVNKHIMNLCYIRYTDKQYSHSVVVDEIGKSVIVDIDTDGDPVGIELLCREAKTISIAQSYALQRGWAFPNLDDYPPGSGYGR